MDHVVVGVDQSDTARRAAERAARLTSAMGANLHLVTCAEPHAPVSAGIGSDQFVSDWQTESKQFLHGLKLELPNEDITMSVMTGHPADALVDEAKRLDADMIVVGNRRVQGAARVLGSVASDVLKKAHCDVLIAYTR